MAININLSLMNPNQRGLWSSATKQMDTWYFSVPYSHPPSLFWICLENSKRFKQNHQVTRGNITKSKLKESLSCPWLLFLYQYDLGLYFLNKEEELLMPLLFMLPTLLAHSFPVQDPCLAYTPRTKHYPKADLCSWGWNLTSRSL